MQVELYHQILIWPLKIEASEEMLGNWLDSLERFVKAGANWQSVSDAYLAGDDDNRLEAGVEKTHYAEFVYFHPFVQRLLFSKESAQAFRALRRDDIKKVRVKLASSEHVLDVLRVRLYLVRTGIVLLTVEVRGQEIDLHEVQDLADSIRRSYPPYWTDTQEAGLCPREVNWLDAEGNELASSNYGDWESHLRFVRERRHPPVSSHWQWLLGPLHSGGPGRWLYRHIEDERIPSMCYFALADPTQLKDGDFFRLGLLDPRGDSQSLPYATPFFQDFLRQSSYDRFWDWKTPGHEWMTTRYLCTGFSFVMIGRMKSGFYENAQSGALAHFRHHYFHLGLIGQMQKASLLVFSGRLADCATDPSNADERERNYAKVERLVSDIAEFTGRFWFTELSNQLQGRELFTLWSQQLGTQRLFQQVMDSTRFVQQDLADYQRDRQTRATLSLTKVGAYGVPLSLMLTLGLSCASSVAEHIHLWWGWPTAAGAIGTIVFFLLLGFWIGWLVEKKIERSLRS